MAYNEGIAGRIREALADVSNVEEKKMFGGLAFMVNSKMCINIGKDNIMCRINPAVHDEAIKIHGIETVKMRGRDYRGFIYINEDTIQTKEQLDSWIKQALDYNPIAKASGKR
jgi:TfoX/Sxy family transcriptional regulator of competence genes